MFGFEEQQSQTFEQFKQDKLDLTGANVAEKIKTIAVSREVIIVLTERNKVYRWKTEVEGERFKQIKIEKIEEYNARQ